MKTKLTIFALAAIAGGLIVYACAKSEKEKMPMLFV